MDHPHSVQRCTPVLLDKSKESPPCHQGPTLLVENEIEGVGVGGSCSPRRQIPRRYIAPAGPLASYFSVLEDLIRVFYCDYRSHREVF